MIDVALLSVIRRWHFRDGIGIREITRRTGLSRNTVRKYLQSGDLEPKYKPRTGRSKLDEYEATLSSWLHRESRRSRKQRRSVKQLYQDLVKLGYTGSYDRVAAYARSWREQHRQSRGQSGNRTYVPLRFAPGEAFQFDWSEDYVVVGGRHTKLQIAQFKLCHSRAFYLRAYLAQTHEMLFDAHNHAFRVFGGVPERGIYDNMKTAVNKVGRGKRREVNVRFQALVGHYLYEPEFCNPAAGWEKGQIEKNVRDVRHRIWHQAPEFGDLAALNAWLEERCRDLWQQNPHAEQANRTIEAVWQEERSSLMPVNAPFDGYIAHTKRVSSTCLIAFENNRYSVPAPFANQAVSLHVYAQELVIVAEGHEVARHIRVFSRDKRQGGRTVYDWRHYLAVVQRKPGALRNGAPFHELPAGFRQLQAILVKREGGDREMADILALVLHHDEAKVEQAVEMAMQGGMAGKQHVLNCLHRLEQAPRPEPVRPPEPLRLIEEPVADTGRYDGLRAQNREKRHAG